MFVYGPDCNTNKDFSSTFPNNSDGFSIGRCLYYDEVQYHVYQILKFDKPAKTLTKKQS
jgi:hypothetical protein